MDDRRRNWRRSHFLDRWRCFPEIDLPRKKFVRNCQKNKDCFCFVCYYLDKQEFSFGIETGSNLRTFGSVQSRGFNSALEHAIQGPVLYIKKSVKFYSAGPRSRVFKSDQVTCLFSLSIFYVARPSTGPPRRCSINDFY